MTEKEKKDLNEAIEYLFVGGFIEEMTSDKHHYTKILLNHAAKSLNQKLEWPER